jgi:hypothetical protein
MPSDEESVAGRVTDPVNYKTHVNSRLCVGQHIYEMASDTGPKQRQRVSRDGVRCVPNLSRLISAHLCPADAAVPSIASTRADVDAALDHAAEMGW